MMAGIDFEAEGLLGNLTGKAREARLALLNELADQGVSLEELKRAVEENRLVLLPVERVFDSGTQHYTARQIAELAGLEHDFLLRLCVHSAHRSPRTISRSTRTPTSRRPSERSCSSTPGFRRRGCSRPRA